ncbi:MAG: cytochrome c oxidase accessory protein CcoG [Myxococcota bacterium]|jgi:cytochrome c oxidase accessory protein FixG|nr:cytochrome c oxidase accessory protein CcoG [Myxococcota bacterium]
MPRHLPVLPNQPASSLNKDGTRNFVHPADVSGRFTNVRWVVFAVLMVIYLVLPLIQIGGRPAVFLDVEHRRFFLFGGSFNAQDFWLVFFLLTGIAFVLIVVTTLWGRVWCGYACPQTVFLEGVYRRIERFVEGPRNERMKRNAGPWNASKTGRKIAKHALFVLFSLFFSHFFLSYFVSLPSLLDMMQRPPSEHPQAFAWMAVMSVILYGNFAWFREQLCLIICPYGRLQSTLTDRDTLVIGYDVGRGEPRGKKKPLSARDPEQARRLVSSPSGEGTDGDVPEVGDCVDCGRCVHVCPTGIDIRNGLQLECIGCAACVDACDDVMTKLKRPTGLIRYDSQRRFDDPSIPKKIFRPRLLIYVAVFVAWVVGMVFALRSHEPFAANLLRPPGGTPYVVEDDLVRNTVQVHLVNKTDHDVTYHLEPVEDPAVPFEYVLPMPEVELAGGADRHVPVIVRLPEDAMRRGLMVRLRVRAEDGDTPRELTATFLGPLR